MFSQFISSHQQISPREAASGLRPGTLLIDVREPGEYAQGHAAHAVNYPLSQLEHIDLTPLTLLEAVYVICQSGGRSSKATDYLVSKEVRAINVTGGTSMWLASGLPLEK